MEAYRAETTVGKGGELHIDHVPFKAGERVEVIVIASAPGKPVWPEGFFASTFGAISDESFFRH